MVPDGTLTTILAQSSPFTFTSGAAGAPAATAGSPGTSGRNSATTLPTSPSHVSIAPIVGGVIGGVLVVAILVFAIFYSRRRRPMHSGEPEKNIEEPKDRSSGENGSHNEHEAESTSNQSPNNPGSISPFVLNPRLRQPISTKVAEAEINSLANQLPTPLTLPQWSSTTSPVTPSITQAPETSSLSRSRSQSIDPDEDAQLIHRLYNLKLPAADIARVVEGMRAERARLETSSDVVLGQADATPSIEAPPRYEAPERVKGRKSRR